MTRASVRRVASRPVALLLTAVALLVVAGHAASLALFASAVGLVVALVTSWASVALAVRRVHATRLMFTDEAEEGETIDMRFDVRGLERLPVAVEAPVGSGRWVAIPDGGGTVPVSVGRRGAHVLGPSSLRVRDLLGIFERRVPAGEPESLLVKPAPERDVGVLRRSGAAALDPEPEGLESYVAGMPVGRIHWPALARGRGLHARRIVPLSTGAPLVIVDTLGARGSQAVDWAARVAAGHILRLATTGGCRVLLPGDRAPTEVNGAGAQWREIHRRLAVMEPGQPAGHVAAARERGSAVRIRAAHAPARPSAGVVAGLPRK